MKKNMIISVGLFEGAKPAGHIRVYWVKCRFSCNGYISRISIDTAIIKWGHRDNFQMLNACLLSWSLFPKHAKSQLDYLFRKIAKNNQETVSNMSFPSNKSHNKQTWNFLCRRVPWATAPWTCRKTQLCTVVLLNPEDRDDGHFVRAVISGPERDCS